MEETEKILSEHLPDSLLLKISSTTFYPDETKLDSLFPKAYNKYSNLKNTAKKCFKTIEFVADGTKKYRGGCAIDSEHQTKFQKRIVSLTFFHKYLKAISEYVFQQGRNEEFKDDVFLGLEKLKKMSKNWIAFNYSHLSFQDGGLYCLRVEEYKEGVKELREVLESIMNPLGFILNEKYQQIIEKRRQKTEEEEKKEQKENGDKSNHLNDAAIVKYINLINNRRRLIKKMTKKIEVLYSVLMSTVDSSHQDDDDDDGNDEEDNDNEENQSESGDNHVVRVIHLNEVLPH